MYSFIFYFIYRGQLIDKSSPIVAKYISCLLVALIFSIHLLFLYSILRFIAFHLIGKDLSFSSKESGNNATLFWVSAFIPIVIFFLLFFKKSKIERILKSYEKQNHFYNIINIAKFVLIFLLPLIVSIVLVNHSIYY